jgi:hypothetical protein
MQEETCTRRGRQEGTKPVGHAQTQTLGRATYVDTHFKCGQRHKDTRLVQHPLCTCATSSPLSSLLQQKGTRGLSRLCETARPSLFLSLSQGAYSRVGPCARESEPPAQTRGAQRFYFIFLQITEIYAPTIFSRAFIQYK